MSTSAGRDIDLGLVNVSTDQLRTLLRGLHRGTLSCPLTPAAIAGHGLQDVTNELLGLMRDLDRAAVHAVLVAVIAERLAAERSSAARSSEPTAISSGD